MRNGVERECYTGRQQTDATCKARCGRGMIIRKSPAEIEAMKEAGRVSAKVLREVGAQRAARRVHARAGRAGRDAHPRGGRHPRVQGIRRVSRLHLRIRERADRPRHPVRAVSCCREGDIISIDTGAIVDGWVGDNAWTYAVGPHLAGEAAPAGRDGEVHVGRPRGGAPRQPPGRYRPCGAEHRRGRGLRRGARVRGARHRPRHARGPERAELRPSRTRA